jgi:uncharacterized membrane protein
MFSSLIMGFIQLGKEVHTSSMVQSLTGFLFSPISLEFHSVLGAKHLDSARGYGNRFPAKFGKIVFGYFMGLCSKKDA